MPKRSDFSLGEIQRADRVRAITGFVGGVVVLAGLIAAQNRRARFKGQDGDPDIFLYLLLGLALGAFLYLIFIAMAITASYRAKTLSRRFPTSLVFTVRKDSPLSRVFSQDIGSRTDMLEARWRYYLTVVVSKETITFWAGFRKPFMLLQIAVADVTSCDLGKIIVGYGIPYRALILTANVADSQTVLPMVPTKDSVPLGPLRARGRQDTIELIEIIDPTRMSITP